MSGANINALVRIGGIATMPSRAHTFEKALASILPQVDRLFVFFDKFIQVPAAFVGHAKIVPLTVAEHGKLEGSGKFLGVKLYADPCLYFCFDDDILYPPDYVEVMTRALYRHYLRAVVGLHGAFFRPPFLSFRQDRKVFHFTAELAVDAHIDTLGTGTIAFHTGNFRVDPRDWPHHDMDDLMIAIEAVKREMPRIAIRRPKSFLHALAENQPDSVYHSLNRDDSRQSAIMRAALDAYPYAWQRWGFGN